MEGLERGVGSAPVKLKDEVYKTVARPTMLYAVETVALEKTNVRSCGDEGKYRSKALSQERIRKRNIECYELSIEGTRGKIKVEIR